MTFDPHQEWGTPILLLSFLLSPYHPPTPRVFTLNLHHSGTLSRIACHPHHKWMDAAVRVDRMPTCRCHPLNLMTCIILGTCGRHGTVYMSTCQYVCGPLRWNICNLLQWFLDTPSTLIIGLRRQRLLSHYSETRFQQARVPMNDTHTEKKMTKARAKWTPRFECHLDSWVIRKIQYWMHRRWSIWTVMNEWMKVPRDLQAHKCLQLLICRITRTMTLNKDEKQDELLCLLLFLGFARRRPSVAYIGLWPVGLYIWDARTYFSAMHIYVQRRWNCRGSFDQPMDGW